MAEIPDSPKKASYIGAPAVFALELACQHINAALGHYGCYLVGSSMEKANWRDVDIRFIMPDAEFSNLFPSVDITTGSAIWEFDPRWLLFNISITEWLRKQTGLPVDFQIQPQTFANEHHPKQRSALGLRIAKRSNLEEDIKPFIEEMEEKTIPAIVEAIHDRQVAASEDRGILNEAH
jgi:hypothetical protein